MSSTQKTFMGILAFLPFIMGIYFAVSMVNMILEVIPESRHEEPNPRQIMEAIMPMFFGILLSSLLSLTQIIVYVIHAVNDKSLDSSQRTMWILLFIFVSLIAAPIYFFTRVINQKPKEESGSTPV